MKKSYDEICNIVAQNTFKDIARCRNDRCKLESWQYILISSTTEIICGLIAFATRINFHFYPSN